MTNSPINPGQNPDKIAARNEKVLAQLVNAISLSQGEFKLILAIADSDSTRTDLAIEVERICREERDLNVERIWLDDDGFQSADLLDGIISQCEIHQINHTVLDGIVVPNIVDLPGLERFWVLTNQSRDRLREELNCPVVLWLDSAALEKMVF